MDAVPVGQASGQDVALARPAVGTHRARCGWDDQALAAMYRMHYTPLVRLAALLVRDVAAAEDVVQDSFIAMCAGWRRLRDHDKAVAYLRQTVVNRSRSALRRRAVAERYVPALAPQMPSAEEEALARVEHTAVAAALGMLSPRQREALVLRYYADLPLVQIAAAMGISTGAVKAHLGRAMASLRAVLAAEAARIGHSRRPALIHPAAGAPACSRRVLIPGLGG
jgi:RNA polymerase sigma-70 factor (sigma-E family)